MSSGRTQRIVVPGVLSIFAKVIARGFSPIWSLLTAGWFTLQAQPLRFQHITTEDGLSDNAVTCVFEDRAGSIWIGTERGLNRYDGQRVDRFPPGDTGPLGAHITSIAEDGQGRLWVSTADAGLSMRDGSGRFSHIGRDTTDAHGLPDEALNQVLVVDDSLLVLCSRGSGAIWYHLRRGMLMRKGFRPSLVNTKGDTVFEEYHNWSHGALRLDDRRICLPMLRSNGTPVVDARSGVLLSTIATTHSVTNGMISDGALYMGGWHPGLQRAYPDDPGTVIRTPIAEEITAMTEWGKGRLLVATKVDGLLLLAKDGRVIERYQHQRSDASSLRSDRMTCLLRDRAGNLWAGTAKGLSVHAPSVWRCETVPLATVQQGDLVFHAIAQDDDGTIRISTSKGFVLVDPVTRAQRSVPLEHNGLALEVTGLFRTTPGEWFIGTETGVFRYDPVRERLLPGSETGKWESDHPGVMFQTRVILNSTLNGHDLLILGALGYGHIAVDRLTGVREQRWSDHPHDPGTFMLRSTLQDDEGVCWSATQGGVVRWTPVAPGEAPDGAIFSTRASAPHQLPGDDAQGLARSGDSIWVALRDAGAALILHGKAEALVPPGHMPHDALGVALDARGRAWFTTSDGLLRFDPHDASWFHVPVNDGRDFRQLTRCITALRDGRIAFCADDHLLLLDPTAYEEMPELPVPRMVGISNTWGLLEADGQGQLKLPFRNSAFDAMITALQPVGVAPLTFLYRLEDEGAVHREVGAREALRYSGVAVGSHRLLVRVRDAYGREGPEHMLLTVTVAGPFWQRWWFFLLVLCAGALGMYLVSRFRLRQRAKLQRVRDRIARDLHDDIGSTLGSISFYSEALKRKLGGTHDAMARQVAEKIGASSREMIDQMSDIVWSVDPKNDDAGALSERLHAFASDLLATRNIALDFRADQAINDRKLSAEQRRNIFLICKEVLHNTVKYAEAGHVTMTLITTGRSLELCITDDGKGFDPRNTDSYNGNGLPNMRTRAEAISAQFTIDSAPGKGTCARVILTQEALTPRSGD